MSKLFYVIGASAAGKQQVINYARKKINGARPVIFAHQYITMPSNDGIGNHISLSGEEFRSRLDRGAFSLYWYSNGCYYGVGSEIDNWMHQGYNVVINGSRKYLNIARLVYPDMVTISVEASPQIMMQRLQLRGNKISEEILEAITQSCEITSHLENCIRITNNGTVEQGGDQLVTIICNES